MTKNKIYDISEELAKEFGEYGKPERAKFDDKAYAFYTFQILNDTCKKRKNYTIELASRIGVNK
jgi:hypothetical protein